MDFFLSFEFYYIRCINCNKVLSAAFIRCIPSCRQITAELYHRLLHFTFTSPLASFFCLNLQFVVSTQNGEKVSGWILIFFFNVTNWSGLFGCQAWRQGMDLRSWDCSNLFSSVSRGFDTSISMIPFEALCCTLFLVNVTLVDSTGQQINSKSFVMLL